MYLYETLELSFIGKKVGNPFTDYEITAEVATPYGNKTICGFYDGDGIYKIRFMPEQIGSYRYQVQGSFLDETDKQETPLMGSFEVTENPDSSRHGKVQVVNHTQLAYSDGTPHLSFGTTCYAWTHQCLERQAQTLKTLKDSCFNKIRFCVFPKYYRYNEAEPLMYPYLRGAKRGIDEESKKRNTELSFYSEKQIADITDFDCYQFNTAYFQLLDERIRLLQKLGIEADLILFHPYDKWGFANMTMECNELYLRYMTARYSAFANVWWSMANEYDLTCKTIEQWEQLAQVVVEHDPYHHMISIHNCVGFYDYSKPWITHCSMQRQDMYKHAEYTDEYIEKYNKPVIWDEIAYEGNIDQGWGNISGEELTRRFWEAALRGGFAGHGETYENNQDILWWSHGGVLHGTSEPRLAFLKKILDQTPGKYLKKTMRSFDELTAIPACSTSEPWKFLQKELWYAEYELYYYGTARPSRRDFSFREDERYQVDVIDTWNMTITDAGIHSGFTRIELPGREYMAIRIRRM